MARAGLTGGPVALGLDVGTSGAKAVALDETGGVVAEASRGYALRTPRPGWTEQDPADWWAGAAAALREVAARVAGERRGLLALGLSGQMHGLVALDEAGAVLRPALLWNDQRTGAAVARIHETVDRAEMIRRTGNPAVTGFQLAKLVWLREAEPDRYDRVRRVLLPKDWLGLRLTGRAATEWSDASGTNAFDPRARRWAEDVLRALGLPPAWYPEAGSSDAVVGELRAEAAAATGLPAGLPVVAGAGDNAAAATALGLASDAPELGSLSLGTSGVLFAPAPGAAPDGTGRVHLFCHADGGTHLLAVTLAAAGSLRWLRDTLFPGEPFAALVERAAASPPGARGVLFHPYLAGERTPHLDPDLRGAWSGLSLATGREDLVRAVLEGVAYSLRDALGAVRACLPAGEGPRRLLATGGGAASDAWLRILADVLGLPLGRPVGAPGAAHGAARLALRALAREPGPPPAGEGWLEPAPDPAYAEAYARFRAAVPRAGAGGARGGVGGIVE